MNFVQEKEGWRDQMSGHSLFIAVFCTLVIQDHHTSSLEFITDPPRKDKEFSDHSNFPRKFVNNGDWYIKRRNNIEQSGTVS